MSLNLSAKMKPSAKVTERAGKIHNTILVKCGRRLPKSPEAKTYIYLIKSDYKNLYKIGVSSNPEKRIQELSYGGVPARLELVAKAKCVNPLKVERNLHKCFTSKRYYSGTGGNQEWYQLDEVEVNFVVSLMKLYERNDPDFLFILSEILPKKKGNLTPMERKISNPFLKNK